MVKGLRKLASIMEIIRICFLIVITGLLICIKCCSSPLQEMCCCVLILPKVCNAYQHFLWQATYKWRTHVCCLLSRFHIWVNKEVPEIFLHTFLKFTFKCYCKKMLLTYRIIPIRSTIDLPYNILIRSTCPNRSTGSFYQKNIRFSNHFDIFM